MYLGDTPFAFSIYSQIPKKKISIFVKYDTITLINNNRHSYVMKYMAIVECVSSGRLYVDDIISHGYRPLVINVKDAEADLIRYRGIIRKGLGDKVDYIDETEDFDEFIDKLKAYDIEAVFPGSEHGVRLADRIVKALGLRGNDADTTYLRSNKQGMYEALGKAGLRRIEGRAVTCEDDIVSFWKENDLDSCVLKYAESAGTVGFKICSSIDDALEHYKHMIVSINGLGTDNNDVLIQEFIGGTEFIVDSLSCDGRHMITDIWSYTKVRADDGTLAYDYIKLVKDMEPGHSDMVQYVYKVLDAVDMKWGLCHTEIKIDKKGPVLIETNARPLGLAMTSAYLDEILGYHLTDMAVDIYLDPKRFDRLMHRIYNPPKYAMMKTMIVPEDIEGSFGPTFVFSNMIRSTRELLYFGKEGVGMYPRTVDLETVPLVIKMANSDYGELMRDYEVLRTVESRYFHLFYTLGEDLEGSELKTDTDKILKTLDPNRKYLIVKDGESFVSQYGIAKPTDGNDIFDGAIYAVCGRMSAEQRYKSMFRTMHNLRSGGIFIVVPESYRDIRSESVVVDFLMNIAGVKIILPTHDSNGIVYGVKE